MKASELRIGNWFKDRGGKTLRLDFWDSPTKLAMGQTINGCVVHPYTEEVDCAQPIPLTEEWLLKFGLKIETELIAWGRHTELKHVNLGFGLMICWHDGDENGEQGWYLAYLAEDESLPERIEVFPVIKYVHTFQNIVALTGEELTIKE